MKLYGHNTAFEKFINIILNYQCIHLKVGVMLHENDQRDATVYDNLLFPGCCTCFERYFRSSSGASKLYYSFWYYTRMSLPSTSTKRLH